MLAHLGGAGGAVQADHVDAQRLQRGQRGADLRAQQHRAGRLEGEGDQQRQVGPERVQGPAGAEDGRLGLEQVLGGLDDQGVRAAGDQALGVRLEAVAQRVEADVTEGRQLRTGADGAQHPPLTPVTAAELVGHLAGDAGARLGQPVHAVGDLVLGHGRVVGTEGVRLHAVHAHLEVGLVDGTDDVGASEVQNLVAALEVLEVLERRVLRLQHRAHRAVGHHDTLGERVAERGDAGPVLGKLGRKGRVRQRSHEGAP